MEALLYEKRIDDFIEHVFDEEIQLTGITEYGVSWEELTSGKTSVPPQGARFDLAFEGVVKGERINGRIQGVDYLQVRSDGKFMLNIYAKIITDDGETIAVREDGISTPDPSGRAKLNLNMDFLSVSSKYSWLNKKQVWTVGEVNMLNGEVKVTGYSS